ncbi:hypothetical protein [Salinarimonas rosea]|uniref:hypothetical protein n=1 Tax=Salinarimonas rosea TaxID=552063 RepID=UPI000401C630|nr:hypothetical protein [Salinarimonas rosea]
MTFTIALSRTCMHAPSAVDVAAVAAAMIWPDDERARAAWIRAVIVEDWGNRLDTMSADEARAFARFVVETRDRVHHLQPVAETRMLQGVFVGDVVGFAILRHTNDGSPSIATEIARAIRAFSRSEGAARAARPDLHDGRKRYFSVSEASYRKANQLFRPVLHLWAAYRYMCENTSAPQNVPCLPEHLPSFLSIAERFRLAGEAATPARSAEGPIIRGAARLPDLVQVEPATFTEPAA